MQFTTRVFKGSPNHMVIDGSGVEVATAHCVNVPRQIFTLVIGGRWSGVMTEAAAVARLKEIAGVA